MNLQHTPQYRRTHWLELIAISKKLLIILIIPLARGLWHTVSTPNQLPMWLEYVWLDAALLLYALTFSILKWKNRRYLISDSKIGLSYGVICKTNLQTDRSKVISFSCSQGIFLRVGNAAKITFNFFEKDKHKSKISFICDKRNAAAIINNSAGSVFCRFSLKDLMLYALFSSNAISGLLIAGIMLLNISKTVDIALDRLIVSGLVGSAKWLGLVPDIATLITLICAIGWLTAIVSTIIKHQTLTLTNAKDGIYLSEGLISRKSFFIKHNGINSVVIKQGLFLRLIKRSSVYISGPGCSGQRLILPAVSSAKIEPGLLTLFGKSNNYSTEIKPAKGALLRYIFIPMCASLLLSLYFIFSGVFNFFLPVPVFLIFATLVFAIWLLAVGTAGLHFAGISVMGEEITLRYNKWFDLKTAMISNGHIFSYTVKKSFFQRFSKSCDLIIETFSGTKYRVLSLPEAEITKTLESIL